MIGDDARDDVAGAMKLGFQGCLVKVFCFRTWNFVFEKGIRFRVAAAKATAGVAAVRNLMAKLLFHV